MEALCFPVKHSYDTVQSKHRPYLEVSSVRCLAIAQYHYLQPNCTSSDSCSWIFPQKSSEMEVSRFSNPKWTEALTCTMLESLIHKHWWWLWNGLASAVEPPQLSHLSSLASLCSVGCTAQHFHCALPLNLIMFTFKVGLCHKFSFKWIKYLVLFMPWSHSSLFRVSAIWMWYQDHLTKVTSMTL